MVYEHVTTSDSNNIEPMILRSHCNIDDHNCARFHRETTTTANSGNDLKSMIVNTVSNSKFKIVILILVILLLGVSIFQSPIAVSPSEKNLIEPLTFPKEAFREENLTDFIGGTASVLRYCNYKYMVPSFKEFDKSLRLFVCDSIKYGAEVDIRYFKLEKPSQKGITISREDFLHLFNNETVVEIVEHLQEIQ